MRSAGGLGRRHVFGSLRRVTLVAAVLALALAFASQALAATTWHVNTSIDAGGVVSPTAASISLRQAIQSAASGDTIIINPGVNPTLNAQFNGPLTIAQGISLTIVGQGANSTTISAGSAGSLFNIAPVSVALAPATVFPEAAAAPPPTVAINNVTLLGTTKATASMVDVGLAQASLTDDTLTGSKNFSGDGGALATNGCGGSATLTDDTISGNAVGNAGGGVSAECGPVTIVDSTITGNSSGGVGGGISAFSLVTLVADTIANNTATGAQGSGGNLFDGEGGFSIQDTIIAGGQATSRSNCSSVATTDVGGNLEDTSPSQCGLSAAKGDLIGVNPKLGTLGFFGGQTQSIPLLAGSQAIGHVPVANCSVGTDQRGMPRPGVGKSSCDIGAFETQATSDVTVTCSPATVLAQQSSTCTATVINPAGPAAGAPTGTVAFTATPGTFASGSSCTLSGTGASASCSVSYAPTSVGSGSQTVAASYSGDTVYPPGAATTTLAVQARPVSVAIACSPGSVTAGSQSVCTATVRDTAGGAASSPSGTVSFATAGGGSFGSASCALSGPAGSSSCTTTYTPAASAPTGTQTISVSYGGDGIFGTGNSSTGLGVTAATAPGARTTSHVSIDCNPGVLAVGSTAKCTVTVKDASGSGPAPPTGSVSLSTAGTPGLQGPSNCKLASSGKTSAQCSATYTWDPSGSLTGVVTMYVKATYGGDGTYASSADTTSLASAPQAGETAALSVVKGKVTITIPHASSNGHRVGAGGGIAMLVPLKGETVGVPVGSTVNATKGTAKMTTAARFRSARTRHPVLQTGTFSVAIFTIEQETERQALARVRAKHHQKHHKKPKIPEPSTDLRLRTPVGAVARAHCRHRGRPGAGLVRAMSATAKGLYRTMGANSITTTTDASWVVKDLCDGTETEVGRGHAVVTVLHPNSKKHSSVKLGPGQAVLIKGRFR